MNILKTILLSTAVTAIGIGSGFVGGSIYKAKNYDISSNSEYQEVIDANSQLQAQLDAKQIQLTNAINERDKLQTELTETQSQIQTINEKIITCENNITTLNEQKVIIEENISQLQLYYDDNVNEIITLQTQVKNFNEYIRQENDLKIELQRQLDELSISFDTLTSQISTYEQSITTLQQTVTELQNDLENCSIKVEGYTYAESYTSIPDLDCSLKMGDGAFGSRIGPNELLIYCDSFRISADDETFNQAYGFNQYPYEFVRGIENFATLNENFYTFSNSGWLIKCTSFGGMSSAVVEVYDSTGVYIRLPHVQSDYLASYNIQYKGNINYSYYL